MSLHVYDTHTTTLEGKKLHFDVLLQQRDAQKAIDAAKAFLALRQLEVESLSSSDCQFCHTSEQFSELNEQVKKNGYAIITLEGFEQ
ncbi:hypothetical protein TW81_12115 [Vibrio galatheae]|uniref:DUF2024 family protein n=1 Tax=Vibrio galatheae TaxID=579748 RepID=A0A0F4NJ39_9VIBR|nr:DUF2024 family protein [Vibrio galatheae]KJY82939.1 hypothetical protein TW81_12115 [Vibrio galatheae]